MTTTTTTTAASFDYFQVTQEVHALAEAAGIVEESLFRVLAASIQEFCSASEDMIRYAREIQREVGGIIDNVNRNLGAHGVESIGRTAADLAAKTALRSSSARAINRLIDALADGSNQPTASFRDAARVAIFGEPQF